MSFVEMRFGDRLAVEWHINEDVLDAAVPTLILQPVVENAIRHGISLGTSVGSLRIEATHRRANTRALGLGQRPWRAVAPD